MDTIEPFSLHGLWVFLGTDGHAWVHPVANRPTPKDEIEKIVGAGLRDYSSTGEGVAA